MSDDEDEHKLSISTTQVIASALAAMSVAFLTSWLGTTGTILGAFLGSVIATVGTATYSWSLRRTSAAVKQTAAQVRQTALESNTLPRTVAQGPLRERPVEQGDPPGPDSDQERTGDDTAGSPSADAEETSVLTPAEQAAAEAEVAPDAPTGRWAGFPWKKTLLATGAVLALSILGITVLEVVSGQSMASLSGHDDSQGTTVGNVVHREGEDKAPAPSEKQTSTPEPGDGETQTPSEKVEPTSVPSPSSQPSQTTSPDGQPSSNASEAP